MISSFTNAVISLFYLFFAAQRRSVLSVERGKAPPRWWLWSQTGNRTTALSCQPLWRNVKAGTSLDTPSLWALFDTQCCIFIDFIIYHLSHICFYHVYYYNWKSIQTANIQFPQRVQSSPDIFPILCKCGMVSVNTQKQPQKHHHNFLKITA